MSCEYICKEKMQTCGQMWLQSAEYYTLTVYSHTRVGNLSMASQCRLTFPILADSKQLCSDLILTKCSLADDAMAILASTIHTRNPTMGSCNALQWLIIPANPTTIYDLHSSTSGPLSTLNAPLLVLHMISQSADLLLNTPNVAKQPTYPSHIFVCMFVSSPQKLIWWPINVSVRWLLIEFEEFAVAMSGSLF